MPGDDAVIDKRVREWRFSYPTDSDRREHEAVRAVASFIREHRDSFGVRVPTAPMGIAVFAIKAYAVFLDPAIGTKRAADVAKADLMPSECLIRGAAA